MSTPQQTIETEVKAALKAGDKERLSTLRLLLGELKNEKIKRGAEVDDGAFAGVLRRMVKQRQDSVEQYEKGNRPELAAKEKAEIQVLEAYLPQQTSEADLRAAAAEIVAAQGLQGPSGIGPAMKAMLQRFGASADGTTINRIVRELLTAK
jgi:uncharacterized protein YqeY